MNIEEKNMNKFTQQIKNSASNNLFKIKNSNNFGAFNIFYDECLYIFDFDSNKIIYNRGFKKLLGYENNEVNFDFIFNNIHPDDKEIVNRIIRAAVIYCLEYPKNSYDNLLTIKYRRQKKDGTYINVLTQSTLFERFDNGELSKSLARLTDISFIDNTENVKWSFEANNLNEMAFKEKINKTYLNFFTEREIEIIIEIKNGLTNKKIGEILKISNHTVSTHRKNIFKKSNCHNSIELISFCNGIGILK